MARKTRRVQEPPLSLSPEIVIPSASRPYERWLLSRVPSSPLVLLPESFRGGCSFGTALKRLLPMVMRRSLSAKPRCWQGPNDASEQILAPSAPSPPKDAVDSLEAVCHQSDFFSGRPLRFVDASSSSSFSVMDFSMLFEAPCKLDFLTSPRFAASAAPAAFCCAFDLAGMSDPPSGTVLSRGKCCAPTMVPFERLGLRQNSPLKSARKRGIARIWT